MKRRGNIAVLLSNWNQESQEKITRGIWKKADEQGFNISIFTCQGGKDISRRYDVGEYNIYELVNLKQFDGIILAGQIIMSRQVRENLIKRIRESHVPAVSLEEHIDGFAFAGVDNYQAMRNMVLHCFNEHSCQRTDYLTGPMDNYESRRRLRAYQDCAESCDIEGHIWKGDYTFESGRAAVRELFASGRELPQALVCANDDMALGVCHELKQRGIKVPEDIAVTGFDNNYNACHYSPSITSVDRPKVELGYMACDLLLRIIEGGKDREVVMNTSMVLRESCGCETQAATDYGEFRERTFWLQQQDAHYRTFFQDMNDEMLECDSFKELLRCIQESLVLLPQKETAICLNKTTLEQLENDTKRLQRKKDTVAGYDNQIYIPFYNKEKREIEYRVYPPEIVFPMLWEEEKENNIYIFAPLHFRDKCFGFIVLMGSLEPLSIPFYFTWVQNMSNAFEELQNISLLNRAVAELNELSVKDNLTGIYNRSAIRKYLPSMLQESKEKKSSMLYGFLDMDGLKQINDVYGHKAGDQAIAAVADTLKEVFCQGEILIRYGGDEFLVAACGVCEDWMKEKEKQIAHRLKELCREKAFPFCLSVSVGCYKEEWNENNTVGQCIKLADERMYKVKCKKCGKSF